MCVIYFVSGLAKLKYPAWRDGSAMYYILARLEFTRWPYAAVPVPYAVTQWLTWGTLAGELAFPILVMLPRTRPIALVLGALFHLATGTCLMLGAFPLYLTFEREVEKPRARSTKPAQIPNQK